jgi:hypothetical protein
MMDERPAWEADGHRMRQDDAWMQQPWVHELDEFVRPSLVVEPSVEMQQSIMMAVLLATAQQPAAVPMPVPFAVPTYAPEPAASPRGVPLVAYVLLAAVLVAYVATISWLEGMFGNVTWVSILVQQLFAASEQAVGRPSAAEPFNLVWQLFVQAPWIALLPLAWWLWDRDRSSSPTA